MLILFIFFYFRERGRGADGERERERDRERERERERESQTGSMLITKPDTWLDSIAWNHDLSQNQEVVTQLIEPPSCPTNVCFLICNNFQTKPIIGMKALLPFHLYFINEDPKKGTEKVAQLEEKENKNAKP